jgi:hypothetical protein
MLAWDHHHLPTTPPHHATRLPSSADKTAASPLPPMTVTRLLHAAATPVAPLLPSSVNHPRPLLPVNTAVAAAIHQLPPPQRLPHPRASLLSTTTATVRNGRTGRTRTTTKGVATPRLPTHRSPSSSTHLGGLPVLFCDFSFLFLLAIPTCSSILQLWFYFSQ